MQRIPALLFALAAAAVFLNASSSSACDIAPPRELAWDGAEKIPGWVVYRFTQQAPVSGHALYARIEQPALPPSRQQGRYIEERVRAATASLYKRNPTAIKVEFLKDKAFQFHRPGDYTASGKVFVVIVGFGPDSVRASGYLRQNARAKNLSMIFAVTHADDARQALPIMEQFASHPGNECTAGDSP